MGQTFQLPSMKQDNAIVMFDYPHVDPRQRPTYQTTSASWSQLRPVKVFEIGRLDDAGAAYRWLHRYCGTMDCRTLSEKVCTIPETLAVYLFTHKPHAIVLGQILRPALIHTTFEGRVEPMTFTVLDHLDAQFRLDMPLHSKPQW